MVVLSCAMRPENRLVCLASFTFGRSISFRAGVFVDNAMSLIHQPAPTDADTLENFETTMGDALCVGLTTIHDAGSSPSTIAFYQRQVLISLYSLPRLALMSHRMANEGRIPVSLITFRVFGAILSPRDRLKSI